MGFINQLVLVGGIPTPLKNMSSSVGMMKFPMYGKTMFQTTNQIYSVFAVRSFLEDFMWTVHHSTSHFKIFDL